MARITPTSGTDADRLIDLHIGSVIGADELTQTRDQERLFLKGREIVAPVHHGDVASEAAMLALNTTSSRGCHRGDKCKRTDLYGAAGALCECISNRGESLSDWRIERLGGTNGGYGDTWGFIIEDDQLCLENDSDGNPFVAIEEIT